MARLASSLRRAAVPLGDLKSEITEWRRSTPLFLTTQNDQYRQSPGNPQQKQSREPATTKRAVVKKLREGSEDTWQTRSATPRPAESMRPAATPPEAPSVAAKSDVILLVARATGLLSFPTTSTTLLVSFATSLHDPLLELGHCLRRRHRRQHPTTRVHGSVLERARETSICRPTFQLTEIQCRNVKKTNSRCQGRCGPQHSFGFVSLAPPQLRPK